MSNFYEILEVSSKASQEVIRAAYKTLMQRYHPDKNAHDPTNAQRIQAIRMAYDILSDTVKRKSYDTDLSKNKDTYTSGSRINKLVEEEPATTPKNIKPKPFSAYGILFWLVTALSILTISKFAVEINKEKFYNKQIQENLEKEKEKILFKQSQAKWEENYKKIKKERQKKRDEILTEIRNAEAIKAKTQIARTFRIFDLTLKTPDNDIEKCHEDYDVSWCRHYINLPVLEIVVGVEDAQKVINHIKKNQEVIISDIRTKLEQTSYKYFTQVDGEKRLKTIIRDQINLTVIGKAIEVGELEKDELNLPPPNTDHGRYEYQGDFNEEDKSRLAAYYDMGVYIPLTKSQSKLKIKGIEKILLPNSFEVH
jgi:curved DNA-binding protein CbpA